MLVHQDRRAFRREPLALRLDVEGCGTAVTRDICPGGIYLLLPRHTRVTVSAPLVLTLTHGGLTYEARAQVLRVDVSAFSTGVALRLHSARLAALLH